MMTRTTKTVGAIAVIVFVSALMGVGVLYYLILKQEAQLEEVVHARAERIATERQLDSLEELIAETQGDRDEIATRVLSRDDVVSIVSLVERLAREHGLTVETENITTNDIPNNDAFEQIVMVINTSGSFEAIESVLNVYDALPFQSDVMSMSLSRNGDIWQGTFTITIGITVYTQTTS